jgi:hypothetical protein
MTVRHAALVMALGAVGCSRSAGTPDLSCRSDAECELSGMVPGDCCGDLCGAAHVYNTKWLAAARPAHDKDCEANRCTKVADCAMPTTKSVARCKASSCVIEEVPR